MNLTDVYFLGGPRLTTVVTAFLFVAVAIRWRRWAPLLACSAWLMGYEAVWQLSHAVVDHAPMVGVGGWWVAAPGYILAAHIAGARIWWPAVAVIGLLWSLWVLTGFHYNEHCATLTTFDWLAEAFNLATKTLWAVAYLVPAMRLPRPLLIVAVGPGWWRPWNWRASW